MTEKATPPRRVINPPADVLGGEGVRGETTACPTGLAEDPVPALAGGDSSPFENVPSGEKQAAAQQPQNAPDPASGKK